MNKIKSTVNLEDGSVRLGMSELYEDNIEIKRKMTATEPKQRKTS